MNTVCLAWECTSGSLSDIIPFPFSAITLHKNATRHPFLLLNLVVALCSPIKSHDNQVNKPFTCPESVTE